MPKWALTEDGLEQAENEEVDDLLNFTNTLDFENYIDDLEIRQAVTVIKKSH